MNRNERLRIAIEKLQLDNNYSQADIMRILKYASPNYLSELIAGKKELSPKFLKKLEDEMFIRKEWIETGKGEMIIDITHVLDKMINDLHPAWSEQGKKTFRVLLEILAKLMHEQSKRPYLECLHDIYGQISKALHS